MAALHKGGRHGDGSRRMSRGRSNQPPGEAGEPISDFIRQLEAELPYPPRVRDQVIAEVRDHLESLAARELNDRYTRPEAEARAISAFGTTEDFITRFEQQGGPTPADGSPSLGVGASVGVYVALVVAAIVWTPAREAWPAIVAAAAVFATCLSPTRRNLGPLIGGAMGAILGNVAIAHYIAFRGAGPVAPNVEQIYVWSMVIGACVGMLVGLVPRLRRDPSPLLWATVFGIAGHVVARLWLEDSPSLTSLATLATGLVLGTALGLHRIGRRLLPLALGTMIGATGGTILIPLSFRLGLPAYVSAGLILTISTIVGLLGGAATATATRRRLPHAPPT